MRTGSTVPHLNCGNVKYLVIEIPKLEKQSVIFELGEELALLKNILLSANYKKEKCYTTLKSAILAQELKGEAA